MKYAIVKNEKHEIFFDHLSNRTDFIDFCCL